MNENYESLTFSASSPRGNHRSNADVALIVKTSTQNLLLEKLINHQFYDAYTDFSRESSKELL